MSNKPNPSKSKKNPVESNGNDEKRNEDVIESNGNPLDEFSKDEMIPFESNPLIICNSTKQLFSCTCPKGPLHEPFWSKIAAANHSRAHGYDLEGNWLEKQPKQPKTGSENNNDEKIRIKQKLEKEIKELEEPQSDAILFSKIEEGIKTSVIGSIVEGLKELAKDPDIPYIFSRLKQEQRVPKNCTFSQFVKMIIGYYCRKFGYNFAFYQDTAVLGPEERQIQKEIFSEYIEN